ncbi:hypothetical protein [Paenibacillus sp. R14(2021)]|uniref:hypothetical protein n=1 Tax=Paenibacillus sp. R14(2021) TaxID=2859228 RepID=UPI001C614778|nr:hypothetical protein [Paenibacillus sp. R14(2021)]
MKNSPYSLIAWGVALDLLNIHVGNIELALIGYLLMMRGTYRLGVSQRYYLIALAGSSLQVILACAAMVGLRMDFPVLGNEDVTVPELICISVAITVRMVTMFGLCSGIQADAKKKGSDSLVHSARST